MQCMSARIDSRRRTERLRDAKSAAGVGENDPGPRNCEAQARGIFATHLFSPEQCARIVRRALKVDDWDAATVSVRDDDGSSDGLLPEIRTALICDRAQTGDLYDEFEERVRCTIRPLIQRIWGIELLRCDGTQLIRYKAGAHYAPHKDSDESEYASRYFTVLCYLNEDFQGGDTNFPSLRHTVRPASGKTVIFPSEYLHAAEPVTQGEKFVFLTWMSGPVPIRWI